MNYSKGNQQSGGQRGGLEGYVTVAERLTAAAGELKRVTTTPPAMLTDVMGYIRAEVEMQDGRSATGMASFRLDLTGGRAQATNPLEDAETSAVGRALAMLGYETKRGVASQEEVREAQRRASVQPTPTPAVKTQKIAEVQRLYVTAIKASAEVDRPTALDRMTEEQLDEWIAYLSEFAAPVAA
jgi:hypothetical protein